MKNALSNSQLFLKKNAPTILTSIGGVGVVTTAVMAAKATPKAMLILEQADAEKGEELTKLEKVKVAAPIYIPTALMGTATLACIFGANGLNKRNQAALTSAYAMVNNSYQEFKKKVEELYGEDANGNVVKAIADEKYEEEPDDGRQTFYDEFSGRFFKSSLEKVVWAEYEVNRDLFMRGWATVNDFYEYLKIPVVDGGDAVGWTPSMNEYDYWQAWVDFSNQKTVTDDGREYYIVRMFQEPRIGWEDFS